MAATKRKAVTDDRPSKKVKESGKEPSGDNKSTGDKKAKKSQEADAQPKALKSILQQEERAFPRGGGSVLTPLEHKQIKLQAENDALLEEQGGEAKATEDDGELFDDDAAAQVKREKKRDSKSGRESSKKTLAPSPRVPGLSYKSLVVGSTVLGRVTAITGRDIALALPNNLTGYVPLTAISDRLNARIEKLLGDDNEDEAEDDEDIDLKQIFYIGQWLRAVVASMGTDSPETGGKSKKHIELSLVPGAVNGGLPDDSFVTNSTIQAAIRSIEDHGIIMDLGLADDSVKGFISKKELSPAYNLDQMHEGQVLLCLVTGKGGKVLKLSPDPNKFTVTAPGIKPPSVSDMPSVDAFLPGTAVDVLVTDNGRGLVGKVMGMLDLGADVVHSGAFDGEDLSKKFKIGSKVKARITYAIPQDDGSRRVGVSVLPHLLAMLPPHSKLPSNATAKLKSEVAELEQKLPQSTIIEDAKVVRVLSDRGLFLEFPEAQKAFAHISQISDERIDTISGSGPYKVDSTHKVRVLGYSAVDNLYYVALKQSILDQAFLGLEDLTVGEKVTGTIEKLMLGGAAGIKGLLVKLSESITGLVPEVHLSDTQLSHPERKFREGVSVRARILSVDLEKRQLRLTLKKSLVEDDAPVWKDHSILKPDMEGKGTIVNLLANGASVQFYGLVRAWLPVAEMSDTFVAKPDQHFHLGQTIKTRIVSVNPETGDMKVSCKDAGTMTTEQKQVWDDINGGLLVEGVVSEKTEQSISVNVSTAAGLDLKGAIRIGHLLDGSHSKAQKELKRLRIGQKLSNLIVLDKHVRSQTLILSKKDSLISEAKAGALIVSFADAKKGKKTHGFVRNITPDGVYVEFANGIVGLMPKNQIAPDQLGLPEFGLRKDQTVHLWISHLDPSQERFVLTMREKSAERENEASLKPTTEVPRTIGVRPGQVLQARIASVKATQVNVRLSDDIQGRVDVSEAFDSWEDIVNKAAPLQKFKPGDEIKVKVLGIHDARNHRFLPISHRQGKAPVLELSAKRSRVENGDESLLSLESVKPGSTQVAFVNNHGDSSSGSINCVWVNLSPNVRGRIALMDLSDDIGQLQNVESRFRIGCALQVTVKNVDTASNRLDLTARQTDSDKALTIQDLSPGMVLPGRVTKSSERFVTVQLSEHLSGVVPLAELSDDFDQTNPGSFRRHDIVRVCVLEVDQPNKKVYLSLRPSRALSSNLPVKDPQITSVAQLKAGDIVRGFVKQVADKGVFVSLGARADALVRIADLSDQYVKDWKSILQIDQLVRGRVVSVDPVSKHVQLSLKPSHLDENYTPPLTINDIKKDMQVTGKVRKVEDFGAFIDIDNTQPRLSGLCHKSEMAQRREVDPKKLYSPGDVVRAIVLKVNKADKKISLGLKASYFKDDDKDASDQENKDVDIDMDATGGAELELAPEDGSEEGGVDVEASDSGDEDTPADTMDVDDEPAPMPKSGLKTSGFDWNADSFDVDAGAASESEHEIMSKKKKKRNPEVKEDMTGDLDKCGPQSVDDFERQLLGQPNDSGLWIHYMSFQLGLSEIQKARDIAERALRTIHIRETEEKANVWIAWLNLEVEYGDDESVEDVFKRACEVQDPLEIHEKLVSIYIDSGKYDKAQGIYERILGKKEFRAAPQVWLNYATFLMDKLNTPDAARALLVKAMHSVPKPEHRLFVAKFGALEFRSPNGLPERGRTVFEELLAVHPGWSSGWDMFVDLERSRLASHKEPGQADKVRSLYERMAAKRMKKRRAKFLFKRWLEFEEGQKDAKQVERVKALAKDYVAKLQSAGDDGEE
ncbi:rRNA biogenesis RRP5 [Lecanosticta acicola]|uniref:rRNA biogenesis protein RRP5 n=1 Tax=Lecanosticta acicola TaxID=111012 RepID=A0AAI9EA14_9PEZI|nr:rRNA biogenesis RRP5 [Lecanosticta acicola]